MFGFVCGCFFVFCGVGGGGGGGGGLALTVDLRIKATSMYLKGKNHVLQRGAAHSNDVDSSLIRVYTSDLTRGRLALVQSVCNKSCG